MRALESMAVVEQVQSMFIHEQRFDGKKTDKSCAREFVTARIVRARLAP
jgi:hypothetical protein